MTAPPASQYRLELPRWDRPTWRNRPTEAWQCFHANHRRPGNRGAVARITRETINAIAWAATAAGLRGEQPHLVVTLVWVPEDGPRNRDADNLWPLLKVACDALARGPQKRRRNAPGLDLVPDDTTHNMTKRGPFIRAPSDELAAGLWLVVDVVEGPPEA